MSRSPQRRKIATRPNAMRLGSVAFGLLIAFALPRPTHAWDPAQTHIALVDAAVQRSAMHLRWMNASALELGLFSQLHVDPDALDPDLRRRLRFTLAHVRADSGAQPLGGPGSCPGPDAPPETRRFCIDGDVWRGSALTWLRLGVLAESIPSSRLTHHFADGHNDREALVWRDFRVSSGATRRRQARSNGEPSAGVATASNFDGDGPTALAWLQSDDAWAPKSLFRHLEAASMATHPRVREHHRALALVCTGALLHVIQDLTVPAHARGDATAFFSPLSWAPFDRGLPMQEFARRRIDLAQLLGSPPTTEPTGTPLASTLRGHLLGEGNASWPGVLALTANHFFSDFTLPEPVVVDASTTPQQAALAVLGTNHGLSAEEVSDARLHPWPAAQGYLESATGRPLAAFVRERSGLVRLHLDVAVYRDQAGHQLPLALEVSRSLLDWLWPEGPRVQIRSDKGARDVVIDMPDIAREWQKLELWLLEEDAGGQRTQPRALPLASRDLAGEHTFRLPQARADKRDIVIIKAIRSDGFPVVLEQRLDTPKPDADAPPASTPPPEEANQTPPPEEANQTPPPETAAPEATPPAATPNDDG